MPFGLQPIHIIIIVAVALIIFGPSKLPEMGRSLGKAITEFRRGTQEMAEGFKDEVIKPVKEPDSPANAPAIAQTGAVATAPMAPPATPTPFPVAATAPVGIAQICPQCKSENPSGARFCNHCGAALAAPNN